MSRAETLGVSDSRTSRSLYRRGPSLCGGVTIVEVVRGRTVLCSNCTTTPRQLAHYSSSLLFCQPSPTHVDAPAGRDTAQTQSKLRDAAVSRGISFRGGGIVARVQTLHAPLPGHALGPSCNKTLPDVRRLQSSTPTRRCTIGQHVWTIAQHAPLSSRLVVDWPR
jgi:hypothetical protein